MKALWIACFSILTLPHLKAEKESHGFSTVIEGVKCEVKAYQAKEPIIIEPLVKEDALPKSRLLLAVMLQKSDITSYLSDEGVLELHQAKMGPAMIEQMRASSKRRFELTGPTAEANPWKGMKYVWDLAFVIQSARGKYLVHQFSTRGGEVGNGTLVGVLKEVNGKWVVANAPEADEDKFKLGMMQAVPKEFKKLQETGSISLLPLEDLL